MASPDRPSIQTNRFEEILGLNDSGSDIANGTIVTVAVSAGATPEFAKPASATADLDSLFLCVGTVPNGKKGKLRSVWHREGLVTNSATVGDPVYLGASGAWTLTPPSLQIIVGHVTRAHATDGAILFDLRGKHGREGAALQYAITPMTDPGTGVAIPVTRSAAITMTTGASGETNTLANPTFIGQQMVLTLGTDGGGNREITVANDINGTNSIMTFADKDAHIWLYAVTIPGSGFRWRILSNNGVVLS